jgi:hypothetical protein
MDMKSAFLNGELQEEVFAEQPAGFIKKGSEHKMLKLKKALYGLHQAPRAWNTKHHWNSRRLHPNQQSIQGRERHLNS